MFSLTIVIGQMKTINLTHQQLKQLAHLAKHPVSFRPLLDAASVCPRLYPRLLPSACPYFHLSEPMYCTLSPPACPSWRRRFLDVSTGKRKDQN